MSKKEELPKKFGEKMSQKKHLVCNPCLGTMLSDWQLKFYISIHRCYHLQSPIPTGFFLCTPQYLGTGCLTCFAAPNGKQGKEFGLLTYVNVRFLHESTWHLVHQTRATAFSSSSIFVQLHDFSWFQLQHSPAPNSKPRHVFKSSDLTITFRLKGKSSSSANFEYTLPKTSPSSRNTDQNDCGCECDNDLIFGIAPLQELLAEAPIIPSSLAPFSINLPRASVLFLFDTSNNDSSMIVHINTSKGIQAIGRDLDSFG